MQYLCCLLFLYASINNVSCSNWLTVDYYEKLIKENIEAAESYEIPTSNAEFLEGFQSIEIKDAGSYDFIIVGAGSAGSVVATRLSEINDWNILLLEAGEEETDFSRIPGMGFHLMSSDMSWGYYSTPQKYSCLGMKNNRCRLPRGKLLGGSSSTNALLYVRGQAKNYDRWAAMGNPGWSFADVLPYFIKSENSEIDGDQGYHGKGGLQNVEYGYTEALYSIFDQANQEIFLDNIDYNGKIQVGYSKPQVTTLEGRRHSTATAFLGRARKRKNVKVITRALVTKIIIDEFSKTAQGVMFLTNKEKFIARARKEVIISCGAVNSPQLLMLSGIGPKEHLNQLNIPVVANLPVGKHLQDHPLFSMYFHTNQAFEDKEIRPKIESYLKGTGPLVGKIDGISFVNFDNNNITRELPTITVVLLSPLGTSAVSVFEKVFNFNDEILNNLISQVNATNDFFIHLNLVDEKAKGQLTLKSSNPLDFPNIDMNYFSEHEDIEKMIKGVKHVLKMTQTEPFQQIGTTLIDYGIRVCNSFIKYSDQYWECVIRHLGSTSFHISGTTVMGNNPLNSVVNANLEVHGIRNLRVVDAGIFPTSISGNTNAPTIMVAEKASDTIKRKYNRLDCRFRLGSPLCFTHVLSQKFYNV